MINIDEILDSAIEKKASDVHLIKDLKPIFRVNRELITMEEYGVITRDDVFIVYEHFTKYNKEMNMSFESQKILDLNYELRDMRLRVNISRSNGYPIFTIRIINKELPRFKDLNLPPIVRRTALLPQGLILVTGKSNSGKTTTLNALVNEINQTENKKILMLENPIEYMHHSIKSLIVQKEVGRGGDCVGFGDGVRNALREDCDILVVGEIRDKETMDAAIEMAEAGHLVIGTMHTRSCSETIDRMISFYEISEQLSIKYMISSVLKAVVTQRLIKGKTGELVMVPEIMIVDETISGYIRKEKFSKSEIEDAIQSRSGKGNLSFMNSLAYAVINGEIYIEQAKGQIEERNHKMLERTIEQLKLKNGDSNAY